MAEKKIPRNAKGEGSFKVNADGTVTHRKSVGFKANGRRKVITVTAKNKSACIREMKKKENEWNNIKNGLHIDSTDTVVSLCYRHLEYQVSNNDLKGKSIDRRECTIENQISGYDLGYLQAQQVTPIDIETHVKLLISENKVGASSIGKVVDVLNAAYEWAIRQGDMQQNPVRLVKTELSKKLKKLSVKGADEADVVALSDEEIKLFEREATELHANGHEKYPAGMYCLLLLHTGMRVGEMIALRWRDWKGDYLVIEKSVSTAKNRNKKSEDENNYISLEGNTKNQKARNIQLNREAKYILWKLKHSRESCEQDDLIVPTKTGKMNTASNLEHRMKVIMKNAGLEDVKGGLHIFRKTFATKMYENGARVEEIAAYIGDLPSTTQKYYIAIRRKVVADGETHQIVKLPGSKAGEEPVA